MLMPVARILELSVPANIGPWLYEDRQARIHTIGNPVKRRLSQAILDLAVKKPNTSERMLNMLIKSRGLSYLGAGVEFSVYRELATDTAVKVHRHSAEISAGERHLLAAEKVTSHKLLQDHLGPMILDQTVEVGEHVLGGYEAVLVKQPFVAFESQDSPFKLDTPSVDLVHLDSIVRRYPGIDDGLQDFISRSNHMYDASGELPDTNGTNNVVTQPTGDVVLLDSTAIGAEHPGVQLLIMDQLASLEQGLREVA